MADRPFRPPFRWGRLLGALGAIIALGSSGYGCMFHMPGRSREPPLPSLTAAESDARDRLKADLGVLAGQIGERNTAHPEALEEAARFIERRLRGLEYTPVRRTYDADGVPCSNIEVTLPGRSDELFVVGAHYDSARGSPGANDNGTGVVALLDLARRLKGSTPERTLTFVFFVNEEPPYFRTSKMGSRVWADEAKGRGAKVIGMLSLETMGFFTDAEGSQRYPFPMGAFYPERGNFLAFVANIDSGDLVRDTVARFRETATLPSEGTALPERTIGVDWSDHASFWRHDWPALMVTDTAPFRYPHYHRESDRAEQVNYDALARAVVGIEHVVRSVR